MAGIFTRPAIDKIQNDPDLTPEQRTEAIFGLFGRALDDGYVSRSAAEEAKDRAVEAAKAEIKVPEPVDVLTTPEYMKVAQERDMLRAIGGDDFASVKPKFRETVYGMLEQGENAAPVAEQLNGIKEKYEEYFMAEKPEQPKNLPVYSQTPGNPNVNPVSKEDELYNQLKDNW